jgi:hypothetical protein
MLFIHHYDMPPLTLELNCFVLGDDPNRVFPIKIDSTESVGTLKKVIKDKKKPDFDQVPADALKVWKVSIPVDENFNKNLL